MNVIECPHCKKQRIVTSKLPKDVVAVLRCPACTELIVLFRQKVIALKREIIEHGTFEQRKAHLAEIIAEFLEPGLLLINPSEVADGLAAPFGEEHEAESEEEVAEGHDDIAITEGEFERFVRIDLQRIDEAAYFKKYFGGSR
jgi:hypothetical protein